MTHYDDAINAVNGLQGDLDAANTTIDTQTINIAKQNDRIAQLTTDLKAAETTLASCQGANRDLLAANAELDRKLADCQAHLPRPTTLFGANVGGYAATKGETGSNAFARILAGFGEINLVRWWPNAFFQWSAVPPYYGDRPVAPNLGSDIAGINAGRYDADLRRICTEATRVTLLTVGHEPEDDRAGGAFTVPQWQSAQMRCAKIVRESGNDLVKFGPLMMGVTYHPTRYVSAASGNVPAAEWMNFDMTNIDFLGADLYQWGKSDTDCDKASVQFDPFLALCAAKGTAAFVGELGTRRPNPPYNPGISQAKRAEYLTEAVAIIDASEVDILGVCYYETDRGAGDKVPWNVLPEPGKPQTSPPATVWAQASTR